MKDKEKLPFQDFCKMINLNYDDFIHDDSPDFLKKDNLLGIELAEYHVDMENGKSKARDYEGLLNTIIIKAKEKYEVIAEPKSNVFFFPNIRREINFRINDISDEIAKLVARNNNTEIELGYKEVSATIYKIFEHIHIYPKPEYLNQVQWEKVEWALISNNLSAIKDILKKKEPKLSIYHKKANENWLLIYTSYLPCIGLEDYGQPSTCGEITPELENAEFESNFDKLFFMDRINKRTIEFSTVPTLVE
jgi:hypothetical protein